MVDKVNHYFCLSMREVWHNPLLFVGSQVYHHTMMMNIEDVKPGTKFNYLGFGYRVVRQTGEVVDAPNSNQWGRRTGGTHKAHKVVVQSLTGRRQPIRYVAYPVGTRVIV